MRRLASILALVLGCQAGTDDSSTGGTSTSAGSSDQTGTSTTGGESESSTDTGSETGYDCSTNGVGTPTVPEWGPCTNDCDVCDYAPAVACAGSVCADNCPCVPLDGFLPMCESSSGGDHCVLRCGSKEDCPNGMFCVLNRCYWPE